jgi:hypothetical protein
MEPSLACGCFGSISLPIEPPNPDILKRYAFVLPLLFILGLAYWRYTFILNPNFSGAPFLIEIKADGITIAPNSAINIKSIIIYWSLFFIGNIALFVSLFSVFEKVKTIGFLFLLLSFFSLLFFGVDAFLIKAQFLFNLAAILKNFLLSPMFTAVGYIIVEYFHWFGKSY